MGLTLTIEDIQSFVKSLFPNRQAKILSYAARDLKESVVDLDQDLNTIDSKTLRSFRQWRELKDGSSGLPYYDFQIVVANQALPRNKDCFLAFQLSTVHYSDKVGCSISELNYKGRTKNVEEAIDKVAELFRKRPYYPFSEPLKDDNGQELIPGLGDDPFERG